MIVTNSRINRARMRCALPMGAVLPFGGGSSAATTNTTNVSDMRVVGGDDSTNVSAQNSTVSVFSTDHGAVAGGLQLASLAVDAASKNADSFQSALGSMFDGALKSVTASAQNSTAQVANAYGQVAAGLENAYATSKAPDMGILKIVAVAAVLIVGAIAWSRKG